MVESTNFLKGAFAACDPEDSSKPAQIIPFRFNPEALSRQLSVERGQGGGGASGAAPAQGAGTGNNSQGADADAGALKESFSVLVRLDLADRVEAGPSGINRNLGILPEISALEDLMYPVDSQAQHASDGTEATQARAKRPLVLFVWGEKRVVPVKITAMTINETFYNAALYPIRAEIEISLEVLTEQDARDNTRVRSSLNFTGKNRRDMANLYFANVGQTDVTLPPPS
ncbi:hypothetical protein [Bradyrhizobium sp.]|jgi:hypothetical protein|uniref:hypothetical protein n=1 Tax=Bradyrhizobium sp. TaxID=376 RepID=UPI002E0AE673|nr:hypothetical protein [Bradyrhizobium sp.]